MTVSTAIPRAGRLDCVCEPGALDSEAPSRGGVLLLAAGFALSILSQVLTLSILPLVGLALAPSPGLATLPFTAFYIGAALASLPASLLLDSFGRRAAFSLGASLGIAGGLVLVWALVKMHFGALTLGALWLGIANGFSLFYRHAAVPMGGAGKKAILLVFGAATLAALVAPTIAAQAEALATPHEFVGMAAAAALAHVVALACTTALPYRRLRETPRNRMPSPSLGSIVLPTAIGAAAWALMTGLMGATPIAMVGCGLSEAVSGTVAWHMMAMYAPSLFLALVPNSVRPTYAVALGCSLLAAAVLVFAFSQRTAEFTASTMFLGIGWSLVTLGATLWIHREGTPSRWVLGLHDSALLGGALIGALAIGPFIGM